MEEYLIRSSQLSEANYSKRVGGCILGETPTSKFQIGSCHGRIAYEQGERVFHRNDVPEKARQAKQEVCKWLLVSTLKTERQPWDNGIRCGVNKAFLKAAPWDADEWDNRYFNGLDAKQRIKVKRDKQARQAYEIRNDLEVGADPRNVCERWNISTVGEMPTFLPFDNLMGRIKYKCEVTKKSSKTSGSEGKKEIDHESTKGNTTIKKSHFSATEGIHQKEHLVRLTSQVHAIPTEEELIALEKLVNHARKEIKHLPHDHKTLVQLENERMGKSRASKRTARTAYNVNALQEQLMDTVDSEYMWNMFPPDPTSRPTTRPDSHQVQQDVLSRYQADTLEAFMEKQENYIERQKRKQESESSRPKRVQPKPKTPPAESRGVSRGSNMGSAPSLADFLPGADDLPPWKVPDGTIPVRPFDPNAPISSGKTAPLRVSESGLHLSPRPNRKWKGGYLMGGKERQLVYSFHSGKYQAVSKAPVAGRERGSDSADENVMDNEDSDDEDGDFMWTCCLQSEESSPGCCRGADDADPGL